MTVREFVLAGLAGIRIDAENSRRRLDHVLQLVGLTRLGRQSVWTLSGGQRQRALVARALVRDPSLLIVDEPTTGLDATSSSAVVQILSELYAQFSVSVVLVTHDLEMAAKLATHAAFFRQGRVAAGRVEEVFTGEQLDATFGLSASVERDDAGRIRLDITPRSIELPASVKTPGPDRGAQEPTP